MRNLYRTDAQDTFFFQRQLEYISERVWDEHFPPLSFRKLVPINSEANAGAESKTYFMDFQTGKARVSANGAGDTPLANAYAQQNLNVFRSVTIAYEYTFQDLRASEFTGASLPMAQARAALRGHEQTLNDLVFFGDSQFNLEGWFTNPYIPTSPVAAGASLSTLWSTKTPDEILADLNGAVAEIQFNSKGAEMPNRLVLAPEFYVFLVGTPRSPNSDTSILNYFLRQWESVGMEAFSAFELNDAFPGGSNGFILYHYDPSYIFQNVSMFFTQHTPQERNFAYYVPCESRFGGLSIPYPLAQVFKYGI